MKKVFGKTRKKEIVGLSGKPLHVPMPYGLKEI